MQTELIEWLDDDVHWPLEVPRLHRIHLLAAEPAVARTESDADDAQLDVPTEFFWRVDQAQPLGKSAWNDLGGDSSVERERFAQIQAASRRGRRSRRLQSRSSPRLEMVSRGKHVARLSESSAEASRLGESGYDTSRTRMSTR